MRIAVLYNKPAERFTIDAAHKAAEEDTELSAKEVHAALIKKGADAALTPITEHTITSVVDSIDAELIFNLIEWTGVDTDYAMQTFDAMNARGLRYTGATKQSYFDSCDKTRMKQLVESIGLPTPQWQVFTTGDEHVRDDLVYPMIVKVSLEHSSVGIALDSIVHSKDELSRVIKKRLDEYKQPVFAESFLTGREFQVTLLEKKDGLAVLPPAEILYTKGTKVPLLTYESRWNEHHTDYANSDVALAKLDAPFHEHMVDICRKAFISLGFRDYARFDIRCDEKERPYFLELNSNPGLGDDDEYGMTLSYKASGMTFTDFVWEIVQSALRRTKE